jgi:ribosome-interacting GTPase 1
MVTNLSVKAKIKWAEIVACRSKPKKIELLREFLSLCPKHKGTEKLRLNVKRRIVNLELEIKKAKSRRKGGGGGPKFFYEKEGAAQVTIIGPTNVGRSSFLRALTNAKPEVDLRPYTTIRPVPGTLSYEDVQFQLIEVPALMVGSAEGKARGLQILSLIRNSDGLIIMVDLSNKPVEQYKMVAEELEKSNILIEKPQGQVGVVRQGGSAGIRITGGGRLINCTVKDLKLLLLSYGIKTALVKISGKVSLDDVEHSLFQSNIYKSTMIVANKNDFLWAKDEFEKLLKAVEYGFKVLPVSCKNLKGLEKVAESIFQMLQIIRIYTKEPRHKEPSPRPVVAKTGTTINDITKRLHSTLSKKFKYARVWGSSAKYPGEKVGARHVLIDKDLIEIHT